MDQGVNLPFSDQGIDPAEFGMPIWEPKWHKVIIVGSASKPLSDASKGGRLQFKIRNEAGQEHFIGLNIWHVDADTKARADRELASICHVTGVHQFTNTAQLYNIPFYVLAETNTSAPTPQYPNPKPQTNFRGYRDINGNEPGKSGGGAGPASGPPANFGAPQGQPQQQAPQFGAPAGQMPQQQPAFGAPAQAPAFGQPPQGNPAQQFQQPQQAQQPAFNQQPAQPNQAQQWQPQGAGPAPQQQAPAFGQPQQQGFQQAAPQQGGGQAPWQQ